MAEWTNDLVFHFLERYASEPALYDPKHPHHKNKKMINSAWLRIQQNLAIDMPLSELKKKKDSLMASFRYHMRKKKEALAIGDPSIKASWFAFDYMYSFLGQIYENDIVEESEPVLEFVDFDTLDDSSPVDSPSTTHDNSENVPETKQEAPNPGSSFLLNALNDNKFKFNYKEEKLKTAPKRKQSPDVQPKKAMYEASQNDAEDDCDLYGRLIAKKLRKLPEPQRERLMYEIQGLFLKVSQY